MIRTDRSPVCWVVLAGFLIVSAAYAQQPLLQITSPSNQSLAPEGQTLTITVAADPSVQNSDHAGTPENYKTYVTGGAMGGGGSNYTGSNSGTASVTPAVVPGCQSPTGGGSGGGGGAS